MVEVRVRVRLNVRVRVTVTVTVTVTVRVRVRVRVMVRGLIQVLDLSEADLPVDRPRCPRPPCPLFSADLTR